MHTSLFHLTPGQPYAFFATHAGASNTAAEQSDGQHRIFLGYRTSGDTPCLEVARATGKTHLITIASVIHVRPVTLPD